MSDVQPESSAQAQLTIRRQDPRSAPDRAAVRSVTLRAVRAGKERTADLVEQLQDSDAAVGLSFIGELAGDAVGHVMLTRSWVDAPDQVVDVLILSPLSVVPEHQRQGIGRALVDRALAAATEFGAPAVFLEGDPAYYSRLGFVAGSTRGFTRPSVRIPEAAFQVVTLPAHEEWMSGALVYADRFWALDCVGLR